MKNYFFYPMERQLIWSETDMNQLGLSDKIGYFLADLVLIFEKLFQDPM